MKIHTLQIAINHYHPDSGVSSLSGCENDIQNMTAYLESRFSKDQINARVLINEKATYENIVKHLGEAHLLKAEKGDLVFIQYSGHGAREGAAPEFAKYAPEGKQETWVCYDSRLPGHYDLADKELAVLIERISNKGAEVILLFDCCHAGSGTRSLDRQLGKSRQWDDRAEVRPLETYLEGHYINNIYMPSAKHLLLAACDKKEKAYELTTKKGNFTSHLLSVLESQSGNISYAQLFAEAKSRMRKITDQQTPQLDTEGFFNAHTDFLGFNVTSSQQVFICNFKENNWVVEVGATKGLPTSLGEKVQFGIYAGETFIGNAESQSVSTDITTITPLCELENGEIYQARLLGMASNQIPVSYQADQAGEMVLRENLAKHRPVYFKLVEEEEDALYHLAIEEEELKIIRWSDGLIIRTKMGCDAGGFQDIFKYLEHIAAWEKTFQLENKKALNRGDIEIVLVELDADGKEIRRTSDHEVMIDILEQNGNRESVSFRVELSNRVDKDYYCALFYQSDEYGTFKLYNDEIPGGSTAIVLESEFELTDKTQSTDIFKLIVSKKKINDALLIQEPFELGQRILKTKSIKGFKAKSKQTAHNDWFTVTMICKCVVQSAKVGDKEVNLANGAVRILSNESGFQADLALINLSPNDRGTDPMSAIIRLSSEPGIEVLSLGDSTTRTTMAPNMLVLQDLKQKERLKQQPLKIILETNLSENENMLPVTFDGEHILPVGIVEELADGQTMITIDEFQEVDQEGRRSLGKALKLCFLKLAVKSKDIHQLCWADYSQPTVERRTEGLITKVKDARNILLVIHGIIGDTKCMAECMRKAHEEGTYDLVLSFDYENLNTPIEKTAAALKVKLREAGIHPPTGKKITILAHSMGGLVSRYFIEELSGKEVVNRLIMAGTPNAGSAFAKLTKYRNHAITILGFAANSVFGLPAAATLLAALQQSKKLTPTLEQMDYDNGDFLKPLNSGDAPGIPYSIVAGHLDRFLEKDENGSRLMKKIFKVGGKTFYGTQSNDIAVSVNSIKSIAQSWTPEVVEVACHHMNYFDDEESVKAIYGMI